MSKKGNRSEEPKLTEPNTYSQLKERLQNIKFIKMKKHHVNSNNFGRNFNLHPPFILQTTLQTQDNVQYTVLLALPSVKGLHIATRNIKFIFRFQIPNLKSTSLHPGGSISQIVCVFRTMNYYLRRPDIEVMKKFSLFGN
jgi:hypothetical protein